MKNVVKVVMVIMGTLIGAGFASGREIYLFFSSYGTLGQLGILISGIFSGFIIYFILTLAQEKQTDQYRDLLQRVNPKHPKINQILQIIVNSFLLLSFFIMIAGFSAYMKQVYEFPTYVSSIVFILFCYGVFQKSLQGVMKLNSYLIPFLLFFIFYLGIKNIPYLMTSRIIGEPETKQLGFLFRSFLYTSYNSIILIPLLINMRQYSKTKKETCFIAVISAICIIVLSFCIHGLLLKGSFFVQELELPLLEIVKQFGKLVFVIYGFVIIISIFTSAISAGYSFLENVSKDKKSYQRNLQMISILGVFVSNIGFSNLVQILYPLFGLLGLLQILFLCRRRNT